MDPQLNMFGTSDTLRDAQERVDRVKRGETKEIECPCCGQYCKLYRQKLYSTMALFLLKLVKVWEKQGGWIDVRKDERFRDCTRNGNYAYLLHWGVVEQRPNEDNTAKRTSGEWKPTRKGVEYVYGREALPTHVYIFDNEVQDWEDSQAFIDAALGSKFDYEKFMRGEW